MDCLSWLSMLTGWQIGNTLKPQLPPGDEGNLKPTINTTTTIKNTPELTFSSHISTPSPPPPTGVDGREHYSSLVNQTWPRVLPAVPHQVIVYEEDSDSEEEEALAREEDPGLSDAIDRAEMLLVRKTL